jgi:uncharacterized membrane protein
MTNLIHDTFGLIHLISAGLALILGTLVLSLAKGTKIHKRMGYGYAISMLMLNATAFNIYHLFHRFGPFHFAALISLASILTGIIPAIFFRKQIKKWLLFHVPAMYYSVIGLYAAFASEVLTRTPGLSFFGWVFFATAMVTIIGIVVFRSKKQQWMEGK